MTMRRLVLIFLVLLLIGLVIFFLSSDHTDDLDYSKMQIELVDTNSPEGKPIQSVEIGDSFAIGFSNLPPGSPVQVYLNDDMGKEWSYARLYADKEGKIEPSLFWYQSGVIGTTSRKIDFKPEPAFVTFEEAEAYFTKHTLTLTVKDIRNKVVGKREIRTVKRTSPLLYPSNKGAVLMNSFDVNNDEVFVTGKHFPPGATVHIHTVANKYLWNVGDPLKDISGSDGSSNIKTIKLEPTQTQFTIKIWSKNASRAGGFDFVARIGKETGKLILAKDDILSYGDDTALLMYLIINGNIVVESAGRTKVAPAKFEFSDSFEKQENIYGAVDPTDVPAVHSGGNYAAYYVVDHQPASYWDGPNPLLTDVSGGIEIKRVKYWCINITRTIIWPNATQADPIKDYDVVVDFGATPAMDAASFAPDDVYNKGIDFIDGYNKVGFWLFEDPSIAGPYPVGQVEVDQANGISGITIPTSGPFYPGGPIYPGYDVTLAWARIMYPATSAGTGTPVYSPPTNYPVALFLHGRHWDCDNDGSGSGLGGGYTTPPATCPDSQRIPSHEGYNYIMERLASQGIVSISVSAHQIQFDNGAYNYEARGKLILKWLDKLRDWNDNGTDPFGGMFQGKLDMTRIALSGHSRGGEGVVAAQELNLTWPTLHSILAVNAIAPTDISGVSYLMTEAPYYLLVGARDGDVANMHGFRTYDRAYPDGAANRKSKTVAWVYGANHNYFNTIWTDTAALGSPNPWAGSNDDARFVTAPHVMTAAAQRQIALTTITAFFRQHLQGIAPYKEIFTGRVKPAVMENQHVYWTYQDADRKAVDNFEQMPLNASQNTLTDTVTAPGFTTFEERLLNNGSTDYTGTLPKDTQFFHDTLGLKLAWSIPQTYTTHIPVGYRDVTMYTHLTLRAAKRVTGTPTSGPAVNLTVNIEDGGGDTAHWDLKTDQFDVIPHPYERSGGWCGACNNQAQLTGVRIPLRNFAEHSPDLDLDNIVKIIIHTEGSGEIGIDDIEFGK